MDIAAVIVYRTYFEQKVFPNDKTLKFIFGDRKFIKMLNNLIKYLSKFFNFNSWICFFKCNFYNYFTICL